jgi:hypothetical protein
MMASAVSTASLAAQFERLSAGLAALHEQIKETHEDVRVLIAIMLRCERRGEELIIETHRAVAQFREFNELYESWA